MKDFLKRYGKALASVLFSVATLAAVLAGDGRVSADEGVQLAIVGTQSALVYLVPLAAGYRWVKTAVEALLAVLLVLVTVMSDGINGADVAVLVTAGLSVLGVAVTPAVSGNGIASWRSTAALR